MWITPVSVEQLEETIKILKFYKVKFDLVGHTSNLYYLDSYNPVVVISTIKMKKFVEKEDYIECECGTPVTSISRNYSANMYR